MRVITPLSESSRLAGGILPHDPAAYVIYGASVHAPRVGGVLTAVDGIQEMRPPATDRRSMAGNHVILRCGGVWVLLGHLQRGSLAVRSGDTVAIDAPLGRVGNSGNTDEPHLHIHAQQPGPADAPLSGDPLPILFGATYPTRNARLRA